MSTVITLIVIGLFLWFLVPTLITGKGKKKARQRFYCRLAGSILVLLGVIAILQYLL